MDFNTARTYLIQQGTATDAKPDALLSRLKRGEPPVPGQVTSILLGLKILAGGLEETSSLSHELIYPLYRLAVESREAFDLGTRSGVDWPPLLDEDLARIARSVGNVFLGEWRDVEAQLGDRLRLPD